MITNQVALCLFFLYFVLMSGECSEVMNCGLQRYINDNTWVKHVMIFLSIYIFTFILNWYTIESLVVEKFTNKKKKINPYNYLIKSFYYTVIVYMIFILSAKNEGLFLLIFLLGAIGLVFGTIFTKAINSELYNIVGKHIYLSKSKIKELEELYAKDEDDKQDIRKMARNQNIMLIIPMILVVLLIFGCYRYYLRQWEDHKHHWSWYIFWLGTSKCRDL